MREIFRLIAEMVQRQNGNTLTPVTLQVFMGVDDEPVSLYACLSNGSRLIINDDGTWKVKP